MRDVFDADAADAVVQAKEGKTEEERAEEEKEESKRWRDAMVFRRQLRVLQTVRHEMNHLMDILERFFSHQVLEISWRELMQNLNQNHRQEAKSGGHHDPTSSRTPTKAAANNNTAGTRQDKHAHAQERVEAVHNAGKTDHSSGADPKGERRDGDGGWNSSDFTTVKTVQELCNHHQVYLKRMLHRCFLTPKTQSVLRIFLPIFELISEFRSLSHSLLMVTKSPQKAQAGTKLRDGDGGGDGDDNGGRDGKGGDSGDEKEREICMDGGRRVQRSSAIPAHRFRDIERVIAKFHSYIDFLYDVLLKLSEKGFHNMRDLMIQLDFNFFYQTRKQIRTLQQREKKQ